jgi:hypothetical protein
MRRSLPPIPLPVTYFPQFPNKKAPTKIVQNSKSLIPNKSQKTPFVSIMSHHLPLRRRPRLLKHHIQSPIPPPPRMSPCLSRSPRAYLRMPSSAPVFSPLFTPRVSPLVFPTRRGLEDFVTHARRRHTRGPPHCVASVAAAAAAGRGLVYALGAHAAGVAGGLGHRKCVVILLCRCVRRRR